MNDNILKREDVLKYPRGCQKTDMSQHDITTNTNSSFFENLTFNEVLTIFFHALKFKKNFDNFLYVYLIAGLDSFRLKLVS